MDDKLAVARRWVELYNERSDAAEFVSLLDPEVELQTLTATGGRRDSRTMSNRVDRRGMVGPYGIRYSWVYWATIVAMFAFLIVDIVDDGAIWNYATIVCIIIAITVRPGGVRGPRAAAQADEPAPRAT